MRNLIRCLGVVAFALLVTRCASKPAVKTSQTALSGTPFSLFVSVNRNLEMEPCGCSMDPTGGIAREWTYLTAERQDTPQGAYPPYFVTGTSFVPQTAHRKLSERSHDRLKATYLMRGFHDLKVTAISPSAEDLWLGTRWLKNQAKSHGLNLISTNLLDPKTHRPIFSPDQMLEVHGLKVLVVGLASPSPDAGKHRDYVIADPIASLKTLLKTRGQREDLLVVLSSLNENDRTKLAREIPTRGILLGYQEPDQFYTLDQYSANWIFTNVETRGRGLLKLDLGIAPSGVAFYSDKLSPLYAQNIQKTSEEIARYNQLLKRGLASSDAADLAALRDRDEDAIRRWSAIPKQYNPSLSSFEGTYISLNARYDQGENPLSRLVSEYKEAVRRRAIDEIK